MGTGIESVPVSSLTLATFVDGCLQLTNLFLLCGAQVETPADPAQRLVLIKDDLEHVPETMWRCALAAHARHRVLLRVCQWAAAMQTRACTSLS